METQGSGDGSAFTLSGTNLDDWQSFRVGHAPLAKPFITHAGMNALKWNVVVMPWRYAAR